MHRRARHGSLGSNDEPVDVGLARGVIDRRGGAAGDARQLYRAEVGNGRLLLGNRGRRRREVVAAALGAGGEHDGGDQRENNDGGGAAHAVQVTELDTRGSASTRAGADPPSQVMVTSADG